MNLTAAVSVCTFALALTPLLACQDAKTPPAATDWREAEKGILADYVELTFSDRFVKAGESYFSPDDSQIIFQAVEKPADGHAPDEFYGMYVADVKRDASKSITGIDRIKRISPPGSANTCGWFHPTLPHTAIFASTLGPPTESAAPGYQRGTGRYKWMFPPEMRIVQCDLEQADGTAGSLKTLVGAGKAYVAEGSFSPDGRHLLYCSLESGEGDIFIRDLKTDRTNRIIGAHGYDGGPFFSPDGKRICYRSDRTGDGLLQLMVADVAFNQQGEAIGIEREYQLTDDVCVNWCPFWTADGRRLIYASSILGETNYEIFMTEADPGNIPASSAGPGSTGTIKYGTSKRRITHFDRADVLPALSHDGKWMMWTSRRGPDGEVQLWAARFTLDPDKPWKNVPAPAGGATAAKPAAPAGGGGGHNKGDQITIEDPDSGRIFVYDKTTHMLSEYNVNTHTLTEVTNPADIKRVMELAKTAAANPAGGDK